PRLMLFIWLVFILLFFTKSSSKLPGYILPVFPAAALLIANYLEDGSRRSRMLTCGLTAALGAILLAMVPFMTRFAKRAGEEAIYQAYQPWVLAAGFFALAGGIVALLYARQMRRDLMVLALAVSGFTATQLLLAGFEPVGQVRAGANLLPAIKAELKPDTKVYSVGTYEQSLTFYMERTVTLVDYWDEFTFGLEQQPQLAIPSFGRFVDQWRADTAAGRRVLAITHDDIADQMKELGVTVRVVASDPRRTVIANY
ncbi:MAG TPA: glycosyltransferase family 39 protein, partial [Telluria sp.]|nr:glycosyltransferase family 39 protein [Telluria sp.]